MSYQRPSCEDCRERGSASLAATVIIRINDRDLALCASCGLVRYAHAERMRYDRDAFRIAFEQRPKYAEHRVTLDVVPRVEGPVDTHIPAEALGAIARIASDLRDRRRDSDSEIQELRNILAKHQNTKPGEKPVFTEHEWTTLRDALEHVETATEMLDLAIRKLKPVSR